MKTHVTLKIAKKGKANFTRKETDEGIEDEIAVRLTFDVAGEDPTAILDQINASEFAVLSMTNPEQLELFKEKA